jgi:hypothetical protein
VVLRSLQFFTEFPGVGRGETPGQGLAIRDSALARERRLVRARIAGRTTARSGEAFAPASGASSGGIKQFDTRLMRVQPCLDKVI